jgi:N-hydroxyarylamine O-acetyltransferase
MQAEAYLRRIHHEGPRQPTPEVLRNLHRAHMLSVPFENLDIPAKRPIILDVERLLHKVIDLHRGGFCYELNGAFAWLLRSFGFGVSMLSARVARKDGIFSPEFDHMTLEVRDAAGNYWLADVGFGDCFLEPLSLTHPTESEQQRRTYRLLEDRDTLLLQRKSSEKDWAPQYQFTRSPHRLEQFAPMCHFHQTSPESSFTQRRLCSLATLGGRITLEGMRLITTQNGNRTETEIADEEEYQRLLREKFGVELK